MVWEAKEEEEGMAVERSGLLSASSTSQKCLDFSGGQKVVWESLCG